MAAELSASEREKVRQSMVDPCEFARYWLGIDLWKTQREILQSVTRKQSKTAVKACHSSSKTFTSAIATLWFLARYEEAIVITTAPTANQVEKLLWGEIHALLGRSKYPFPEPNQVELRFDRKKYPFRYATGFTTSVTKQDEGVKFQGFHADHILVILDEAPGVDPKIWDAIEGAAAGGDVRRLALGNPTVASGTFHDAFTTGRSSWNTITISAFDTPNFDDIWLEWLDDDGAPVHVGAPRETGRNLLELSEEELDDNPLPYLTTRRWVKSIFSEYGPLSAYFQARVLGQFPSQSSDALISLAWLEKARTMEGKRTGKIRVGIDVAGPGEDETTLYAADGAQVVLFKQWPQADPRGEIVAVLREFGDALENVNVDSAGIGWYLHQHLLDLGFPSNPVNVGESPSDTEKYANLKAELYWGLRMRFKAGDVCGMTDEKTISQLAGILWKPNSRGQTVIESKEDARKRGVKSPDRAEAVMLCFGRPAKDSAGLLDFYRGLTGIDLDTPVPMPDGFTPAPAPPVGNTRTVKSYETLIAKRNPPANCSKCGKPLGGDVVEMGAARLHPECAVVRY